eukprot:TRINITY_DN64858_c0_g1_i1.p1 TRINITY_DN64858_c0_g1~~TRINITY_DN64858_c0_g1_i1.p1  ORF type:complete len:751 (-),score=120.72 TRINITY_DN64858_c0_g1_i1:104-2356(-)
MSRTQRRRHLPPAGEHSSENGFSNGKLCCLSRGRLGCLIAYVAAGSAWTALLVVGGRQLAALASPERPTHYGASFDEASRFDAVATMREWHADVSAVDRALHGVEKTIRQRDARLASLNSVAKPGALSALQQRARAAAASKAGIGGLDVGAGIGDAAVGGSVKAGPSATLNSEPKCVFQDNTDYRSLGEEDVIENSSPEDCCRSCAEKNRVRPGSCAVGVLSSENDVPPLACWLKEKVSSSTISKDGVKACWPPGHATIPRDPKEMQKRIDQEEQQRISHLTALAETDAGAANVSLRRQRAERIRAAVRHAWSSYRKFAWGADDLRPVSGSRSDGNFRHAVTMVDSLDTLWIVGLRQEFLEARDWLAAHLPARITGLSRQASVFETTIRSFGGLLSAYDLSRDQVFIDLAEQLGRKILATIQDDGTVPYYFGGGHGGMGCSSLAESGTIQLEMEYLSHVLDDQSYAAKTRKFYKSLKKHRSLDGLYPNCWQHNHGRITFGADGDSFYEYLLKVWLLKGGDASPDNEDLWNMFDAAADGFEKHLVKKGDDSLTYIGTLDWSGRDDNPGRYQPEMEHLTCFAAGWLALGAARAGTRWPEEKKKKRMELAKSIGYTCWQMYEQQPTGIAPERVKGMKMDLSRTDTREYILRPEAAEAWFYLSEITKEPQYVEWGWRTFQAFETWLRVPNGYASLKDVRSTKKKYIDRMESFFIAETLKYLYLLQDPDHTIKLDRYVFNTEAHPFSIFEVRRVM